MTHASIYGFALVLLVGAVVALWLTILSIRKAAQTTHGTVERALGVLKAFAARLALVEKQSPTTLAAEVAALSEAVGRLRQTHQRFAGRFDQYVGQQLAKDHAPTGNGVPDDDDFAAVLALQLAKPAGPGNGG